jgi:hypothetical protein
MLLSRQHQTYVESFMDEDQTLETCELLEIFITDGYLPSSELLKKLIIQVLSPQLSSSLLIACHRLCFHMKSILQQTFLRKDYTNLSLLSQWDSHFFWKNIKFITDLLFKKEEDTMDLPETIEEATHMETSFSKEIQVKLLFDIMTMLLQCELMLNTENVMRILLGDVTSNQERSMLDLSLDWLSRMIPFAKQYPNLFESCQQFFHILVLVCHVETRHVSKLIKKCDSMLHSLSTKDMIYFIKASPIHSMIYFY